VLGQTRTEKEQTSAHCKAGLLSLGASGEAGLGPLGAGTSEYRLIGFFAGMQRQEGRGTVHLDLAVWNALDMRCLNEPAYV
jgi:hypothetical protein